MGDGTMTEAAQTREFMTVWHDSARPYLATWSMRNKENLTGEGTSSRKVPMFRPFDLLAAPNQAMVLLENDDHRIGVESVCGAQEMFQRNVDFDTVYFQYAGHTTIETEYGLYTMAPGELILIPEGISHRCTGSADSLRWFCWAVDPFTHVMDDSNHTSESAFELIRHGGPDWKVPAGKEEPQKGGRVRERMVCWADGPSDFTFVDRDYDSLVGVSSTSAKEKNSAVRKLRIFDIFRDLAGYNGAPPAFMRSKNLELKTYNIVGEQFAFHRALRSEEVRIQFRSDALDMSELGYNEVKPGMVTVIPRGIAHSVVTIPEEDTSFLRLNFYSCKVWRYPNDLTRHVFDSRFETRTTVKRAPAWATAAE